MKQDQVTRKIAKAVGQNFIEEIGAKANGMTPEEIKKEYSAYTCSLADDVREVMERYLRFQMGQDLRLQWLSAVVETPIVSVFETVSVAAPPSLSRRARHASRSHSNSADAESIELVAELEEDIEIDGDSGAEDDTVLDLLDVVAENGDGQSLELSTQRVRRELLIALPQLREADGDALAGLAAGLCRARSELERRYDDGRRATGLRVRSTHENRHYVSFVSDHGDELGPLMELRSVWGNVGWSLRHRSHQPALAMDALDSHGQ